MKLSDEQIDAVTATMPWISVNPPEWWKRQLARAVLAAAQAPQQAEPKRDYCPEKMKPGGCQLHNLHCGYPACNQAPASPPPQESAPGKPEQLTRLIDVADAVCKQFSAAGIGAVIGSPNPAEDLHARAALALAGTVERKHIASAACWCSPVVDFVAESGAKVIVHRRVQ